MLELDRICLVAVRTRDLAVTVFFSDVLFHLRNFVECCVLLTVNTEVAIIFALSAMTFDVLFQTIKTWKFTAAL